MVTKTTVNKTNTRKKNKRQVVRGIAHVRSNFNNTIVTITDEKGNKISGASAGSAGNKGSRKATPHAAELAARQAGVIAKEHGMRYIIVKMRGPGSGKDSAVRALNALQFEITALIDVTPHPHNGCRPPKRRRG
jgi:small subunit ribosomal protein S11